MVIGPIQPMMRDGRRPSAPMFPGQVVRLQLVERGRGGGIVNLRGSLYRAAGSLPSRPGENFWAIIEQVGRDRIHVRHVAPAPAESRGVSLADLARVLGFTDRDAEAAPVLRELMRWNLPVQRDTVQALLGELAKLPPAERQAYLASRVWLMTLDLPAQPAALGKMLAYLLGRAEAGPGGQEYLNTARTLHPELGNLYAFSINGGDRFQGRLFLAAPYAGDEKQIPMDRVRLVLSLETAVFGPFWVVLEMADGRLSGRLITPDSEIAGTFNAALPELKRRLTGLGFAVAGVMVETGVYHSPPELLKTAPAEEAYKPLDAHV